MTEEKIGARIKRLREKRGLTRAQLAKETGVSRIAIFYFENNKRKPSFDSLPKLADALEVSIDELVDHHPKSKRGGGIVIRSEIHPLQK